MSNTITCTMLDFMHLISRRDDGTPPGGWAEFTIVCRNCGHVSKRRHMVNTVEHFECQVCEYDVNLTYWPNGDRQEGGFLYPILWLETEACTN